MGSTGIKSFSDIVRSLISSVLSKQPNANVSIGTFIRDLLIDVPAGEIADLYGQVYEAQKAQSIAEATGDHLDRLLANYALYRRLGTKASGTVWFRTPVAPTSDILIPAGTLVRTGASLTQDSVEFVTTESVTMFSALASSYYNSLEDVYEVPVPVTAVMAGTAGNVGAYTILDVVSSMLNMGIVNKTPMVGGTDEESDDEFRERGLAVLRGLNVGTKGGYEVLIGAMEGVGSVCVVTPNDEEMERIKDGGGADVWIYTTSNEEVIDSYTYKSGEVFHVMSRQPVKYVASVSENGHLLVPDLDYKFLYDTSVYSRSVYGNDKIVWITNRSVGSTIEITYGYSNTIRQAQNIIDSPENHIVGVDVLAKLCYEATVDIVMTIEVLPNYDPSIVSNSVVNDLTAFIDALPLGSEVQQSDIIAAAEAVTGVDSVVLPLTTFTVTREVSGVTDGTDEVEGKSTAPPVTGNLKIRKFEFAKPGSIIVNYYSSV